MNDSVVLQWSTETLAVAAGVSGAFCLLALVVAGHLGLRSRWMRLAVMGALETGYCVLMIPYYRAADPQESLFWIQLISVFMPLMTWLIVELTIDIAQLRDHWMLKFSVVTLALTIAFSVLLVIDMTTGSSVIFESVSHDYGTLHLKRVQATWLAKGYLGFVNVAFYVSAFFLFRHWRRVDRSSAPLVVGCFLYFLSITNDFGIIFGQHDSVFLQHFGFLALYIGFTMHHGLEQVRILRELRVADAEVKQHRGQMIESEKLRALGMASAFVTHEMNNVLTLLSVRSELEARKHGQQDQLSDTELAVRQLTELVRSLQTFSRDARNDPPEIADVHRLVFEAGRIARARAKTKGVEIQTDVAEGLWISCRPARIVQALLNLINNGSDAAADANSGKNNDDNDSSGKNNDNDSSGKNNDDSSGKNNAWVRIAASRQPQGITIAVTDSGAGIPVEARPQILEPFFTTKPAGLGTGLGLAVVHDIAERHNGTLHLDTGSEQTRFVITIPAAEKLRGPRNSGAD